MLKQILNEKPNSIDVFIIDLKNEEIGHFNDVDSLEHFLMKNDIDLKIETKISKMKYTEIGDFIFINKNIKGNF